MTAKSAPKLNVEGVRQVIEWRLSLRPHPLLTVLLALAGLWGLVGAAEAVQGYFSPTQTAPYTGIAPLFTPEVAYWGPQIGAWATLYELDPNLLATVMQIESCGHPTVASYAGAQGLFQVMPMHFTGGESMVHPDTNARRGTGVLVDCLQRADGDTGLAMACYNGGPSVIHRDPSGWDGQVRSYYYWGTGIYADALANRPHSPRLTEWLNAGGGRLCESASAAQAIGQ